MAVFSSSLSHSLQFYPDCLIPLKNSAHQEGLLASWYPYPLNTVCTLLGYYFVFKHQTFICLPPTNVMCTYEASITDIQVFRTAPLIEHATLCWVRWKLQNQGDPITSGNWQVAPPTMWSEGCFYGYPHCHGHSIKKKKNVLQTLSLRSLTILPQLWRHKRPDSILWPE